MNRILVFSGLSAVKMIKRSEDMTGMGLELLVVTLAGW